MAAEEVVNLDDEHLNGDSGDGSIEYPVEIINPDSENSDAGDGLTVKPPISVAMGHDANHNNNVDVNQRSPASSRALSPECRCCTNCEKLESEVRFTMEKVNQLETENARLKKEFELASRTKENMVMKYANSEMEVMKFKGKFESADKTIKQLNKDIEIANKKHKMLNTERERLSVMIDSKVHEIDALQKEVIRLNQEISSKDFKITWTQNKLKEETEANKSNTQRLESKIEELEQELNVFRNQNKGNSDNDSGKESTADDSVVLFQSDEIDDTANECEPLHADFDELSILKQKNVQLVTENESLSSQLANITKDKNEIDTKMTKLQDSNAEHLHQIAALQSDLAATEVLKIQLQKESEMVKILQQECQSLKQAHQDVLNDMTQLRGKEADLLSYTQQVNEKNVVLQSELSSFEAKYYMLAEENNDLKKHLKQLQVELENMKKSLSQESCSHMSVTQSLEQEIKLQNEKNHQLQEKLDEARGEIGLLNKKLNSSVRELSKELSVFRKQVKEHHVTDSLSQSSRTSSSSSLTNGDCAINKSHEDNSVQEKHPDQEMPIVPDQQVLVERIVKLQRILAKKQDKIEFLQEHVKQLVESLQKKSRIIQAHAMSQDIESLSSNLSEQNKLTMDAIYGAEVLKHGGIMASVFGSKPADEGMTLELSLEINHKLQVVLEDTLLKNITLKDSLNTLGQEISKLTEVNHKLRGDAKQPSVSKS